MSIKSKVFAVTAALTVAGSVGAAGLLAPTASATTPSCGNNCFTLFNRTFGRHIDPAFVLDTYRQNAAVGQRIILYRQSMSDPAEDFVLSAQGTVSDFYEAGLVSSSLVLHYPPNTVDDHQLWGLDGGSLGTGNPVPGCPPDNRG
jgi:hypothetical protein